MENTAGDTQGTECSEHDGLLAQAEALAGQQAQAAGLSADSARRLVRHYYDATSPDTIRLRSPQRLAEVALAHGRFAAQRRPGETLVRAQASPNGQGLSSIDTCSDDMQYLFDSALIAVRAAGVVVDWAVHPVLRAQRDAHGQLLDSGAGSEPGSGLRESWIHLELDPPASQALLDEIAERIRAAFGDLRLALADGEAMKACARRAAATLRAAHAQKPNDEMAEAAELLDWMCDEHFLFLGYFETTARYAADGHLRLVNRPETAVGLTRAGARLHDQDALIAPRAEMDKYAESARLVVVTKANQRSTIHLDDTLDVISVKLPGVDGQVAGTVRFIGLFASDVYVDRPRTIPLIRRKAEYIVRRAHFPEGSHAAKNLREIMHLLPRDELFQSSEEELFHTCMGIRALRDRQMMKLFVRRDRYGRFYSFMIYLPRERYSRELRDRMSQELLRLLNGQSVDRQVDFLRDGMARVRCIVRTAPGTVSPLSVEDIEQRLLQATRTWRDQLREVLSRTEGADLARFAEAFPLSYAEHASPQEAAADVRVLQRLSADTPLLLRLLTDPAAQGPVCATGLKLYAWGTPLALSDVLPVLENFGLRVIRQEPTEVQARDGARLWIQHFEIRNESDCALDPDAQRAYFESAFARVWAGETEDDSLNRLVLAAGLDWRQVCCVRALAKYVNQVGLPFGRETIERQLAGHPHIAARLVRLFETRFDPQIHPEERSAHTALLSAELTAALDALSSLDADRVLRCVMSVVTAALRTNYYQRLPDGSHKPWIAFKIDPARIAELPRPRPMFEIWVYSAQVEGVHLRGGRVARGGLRWSDRHEDFRTEVLGLMKAQMVKNAVIVPVGAKGGFVVKKPVDPANREAWMAQGIACYQTFLRALLDLTDNRVGSGIQPPPQVVRHDDDDPYLVVAADKGTASFSDIANGVAAEYGFWLGDAFASGGSAGYDHKKMGITARGAWESVKRHFRELGRDIQGEPFTVAGIGDMSGDVFGNGMLLSPQIRLLAAFDHRHIFLDPSPNPATSLMERQRLFALPRSSWADYDATLMSAGGGIWPRSAKSIPLSPQVRAALDIDREALSPAELMSAILRAPVDLLWNGGIGTYVKASGQSHDQVGDRANDSLRVNGRELRCRVVGEGGNLGFTQAGRVEYALAGGRINTDAIDNAGGVHCSDREVNIKIPLNQLLAEGRLDRTTRDPLLVSMTADVAAAVLHDNYVQPSCISLECDQAETKLDQHLQLIRLLERDGLLDRALEGLPDEDTLQERRKQGQGLCRPEIAVLVAYAKISLFNAAMASDTPDDPFFERDLLAYFPPALVALHRPVLSAHRLRREIVATILANAVVNRMGVAFAHQLAEDHGVSRAQVLKAYAVAHEIFGGDDYWRAIEALDNRVPAAQQLRLMRRAIGMLRHATRWLIASRAAGTQSVSALVQRFAPVVRGLDAQLPELLPAQYREVWSEAVAAMEAAAVPTTLARQLTNTLALGSAMDIAVLAEDAAQPVEAVAQLHFMLGERFRLLWLHRAILDLPANDRWQALARNDLRDDSFRLHRELTAAALRCAGATPDEQFRSWLGAHAVSVEFAGRRLQDIQVGSGADFAALVVAVRALHKLTA